MNNRNLIVTLAVVALLTVAATTAGCATNTTPSPTPIPATQTTVGNNTTYSSTAGFNITYNKSLKADTSTDAKAPVRIYIYLNPTEIIDGVLVASEGLAPSKTLNDFANDKVYNLRNYSNAGLYKNFTLNETNSTFAGKPARTVVFSGIIPQQLNQTTTKNVTVKEMQTFVVNNNKGYVVTYKAISSDYDKYLAQAQRIMNSFVLT